MASPSENDSPLLSAVRWGQLEEVRRLLDQPDVDVNCVNSNHETPLHLACALDHSSIIELLVAFGANVFIKDSDNRYCYGRMSGTEICNLVNRLLYSQNLWLEGPTLTEKDGPLHSAVKIGQLEIVQDILDHKRVDIDDKNSAHETPLHIACAMGYNCIVHVLIINGASMCERDSYNNAPIHRAAAMGHIDIVDMLVEFGCDPTIRGYQGRSLLHFACGSGNAMLLEMLVQRKFLDPANDRDACGLTPLHIAALCSHEETIDMLIGTFNCPVDCESTGAYTPLHLACISGHVNIIKLLVLKHNANLSACNFQNDLVHNLAAQFGHTSVIKSLIEDFNCNQNEKGYQGTTILHRACTYGHTELAETLITDFGLDPMCVDDDKSTPLHSAAYGGQLDVIDMLLSRHNVDVYARNNHNELPLHVAARKGHTKLVKAFINDFHCNPNEKGFEGKTILHEASVNGHIELAETLITNFGLGPMCVDDIGFISLHSAAWGGHLNIADMLVSQHNADINAHNNSNELPLHVAARRRHTKLVKALIFINDFNCNPNEKGFEGRTILHEASVNGHIQLAETLITDIGLDPMCVDDYKNTPLHYATLNGHLSVVKMLMSRHNADINVRNKHADSPLQIAARKGYTDIVKVMINRLNHKAAIEGLQSRAALTSFSHACERGYEDLAITLIADLSCLSPLSADSDGNTLLHIAAMHEQDHCVTLLLYTYNAPVYVRNNAGKTARDVTKLLSRTRIIIGDYLRQNIGNVQDDYKTLQLLSSKKYAGEQRLTRVFVVGNILSGKSTLIESLKREGFITSFGQVTENTVPLHTGGIIPSVHDSKTIGRILYYDFAGDPEYYSSHSAIISNVIRSKVGTNVFLIVINFSKDINKIQEELGYWLSFISHHSKHASESKCTVTVMIIGSHVDRISVNCHISAILCPIFCNSPQERFQDTPVAPYDRRVATGTSGVCPRALSLTGFDR